MCCEISSPTKSGFLFCILQTAYKTDLFKFPKIPYATNHLQVHHWAYYY